jgi:hypothetical protein
MTRSSRTWTWLVRAVAGLVTVQAATGLWWRGAYRDAPWIQASWLGNDVVTLVAAVPLLLVGMVFASRGETVGELLVGGVARAFAADTPVRLLGGGLFLIGAGLCALPACVVGWIGSRDWPGTRRSPRRTADLDHSVPGDDGHCGHAHRKRGSAVVRRRGQLRRRTRIVSGVVGRKRVRERVSGANVLARRMR